MKTKTYTDPKPYPEKARLVILTWMPFSTLTIRYTARPFCELGGR